MESTSAPAKVDLRIDARWIIPVIPREKILEHHCLIIHEGKIKDILPRIHADEKYSAVETQSLSTHAVIPGLVNAHGHAAMSLFRGLADDLPLMTWLNEHIWPAEGEWVSPEFVKDGAELAIAEMLRSGTTCFSDMYFFPEIVAETATQCGIRAQVCGPILDFPTVWGSGPDEYLSKSLALADAFKGSELITVALGPHAPYTVSDTPLSAIRELAEAHHLPVQIHLHETAHEIEEATKKDGKRPIARLVELGLIGKNIDLQCVHMTALNEEDLAALRDSNVHVISCPESNMKLASGFCPTQALLDAGINVALGTDGAASNNDLDMFGEMRSAAMIAKVATGDASAIDATTALEMATINGARALGLEQRIGSLEVGKSADCVAIDLDHLNSAPCYNPVSNLVYSTSAHQVTHVWVAGNMLLSEGTLQKMDARKLINTAQDWRNKIFVTDQTSH